MRDDFNKLVKDIVAKRVGLRCSNPNCRVLAIGPHSIEQKIINIGVAAHITAASPGGPRYDSSLTQEERCSIANAIWLCQSCAKLIDSDPINYTVDLIAEWKADAEKEAELELTKIRRVESNSIKNDDGSEIAPNNRFEPRTNYNNVFKYMPGLINEMMDDLKRNPLLREFILLDKGWIYNSRKRRLLVYYRPLGN